MAPHVLAGHKDGLRIRVESDGGLRSEADRGEGQNARARSDVQNGKAGEWLLL